MKNIILIISLTIIIVSTIWFLTRTPDKDETVQNMPSKDFYSKKSRQPQNLESKRLQTNKYSDTKSQITKSSITGLKSNLPVEQRQALDKLAQVGDAKSINDILSMPNHLDPSIRQGIILAITKISMKTTNNNDQKYISNVLTDLMKAEEGSSDGYGEGNRILILKALQKHRGHFSVAELLPQLSSDKNSFIYKDEVVITLKSFKDKKALDGLRKHLFELKSIKLSGNSFTDRPILTSIELTKDAIKHIEK